MRTGAGTLPDCISSRIELYGRSYQLDLSFDRVLRVYGLWREELLSYSDKLNLSLRILVKNRARLCFLDKEEKTELLTKIFELYINAEGRAKKGGYGPRVFDFEQDAPHIYSSFLSDYGIDLFEQRGRLHWRKFIALFQGLSEKIKIREIMEIRARELPEGADAEKLLRLKRFYALNNGGEIENACGFDEGLKKLADTLLGPAGREKTNV